MSVSKSAKPPKITKRRGTHCGYIFDVIHCRLHYLPALNSQLLPHRIKWVSITINYPELLSSRSSIWNFHPQLSPDPIDLSDHNPTSFPFPSLSLSLSLSLFLSLSHLSLFLSFLSFFFSSIKGFFCSVNSAVRRFGSLAV